MQQQNRRAAKTSFQTLILRIRFLGQHVPSICADPEIRLSRIRGSEVIEIHGTEDVLRLLLTTMHFLDQDLVIQPQELTTVVL
jgi:hypothetical protein